MAHAPKWKIRAERYRREQRPSPGKVPRPAGIPAGSTGYVWRIDPQDWSRTRSDHRRLNGQTFSWDDPPVHDLRTGARAHPGMDRYCRCYAEPLFDEEPGTQA